jgi:hypothetical protein
VDKVRLHIDVLVLDLDPAAQRVVALGVVATGWSNREPSKW